MSRSLVASLVLATSVAACGGSDGGEEPQGPDARPPAPDASVAPDARVEPPGSGVASNLPGLSWAAKPGSTPGITFVSSNVEQEDLGPGSVYQNWYAEVRNTGTTTLCYTKVVAELQDASGTTLATFDSYADAAPYKGRIGITMPCIAPGATGAIWDIQNPPSAAALARVTRVSYRVDATEDAAAQPHPQTPTIVSSNVVQGVGSGYWKVEGLLRASATIHAVDVTVYPVGSSGWLVDELGDAHTEVLTQGQTWGFATTSHKGPRFDRMHTFLLFIEGAPRVAALAAGDPEAGAHAARLADADQRRALRAARDAARATAGR